MNQKVIVRIFRYLVYLSFLTPLMVFSDLLFPFVTSKSLYLRFVAELALPFYIYLIVAYKQYRPNLKNPLTLSVLAFLVISLASAFAGVNVEKSLWGNFERMGGVFYLFNLSLVYFYLLLLAQINSAILQT